MLAAPYFRRGELRAGIGAPSFRRVSDGDTDFRSHVHREPFSDGTREAKARRHDRAGHWLHWLGSVTPWLNIA